MKLQALLPFVAILATAAGCQTVSHTQHNNSEIPVSRVVMYQSGIGYVERTGMHEGDELVLHIRPDQINDVLKSLTVIDRADGRPVSISLPVERNVLEALTDIPEQIRDGGIRSLLNAFRGAHVQLKTTAKKYDGRIVGIDQQLEIIHRQPDIQQDPTTVTLLTAGDVLEVIDINEIKSVTLLDQKLSEGLARSLNISLNEGSWKQLELRIRMDSSKNRELALSYLVAMPTWKPAYRLILKDNDLATLQGWAVISNVSGSDWNNIAFSLVSGQPMSFTYDLYTPQFIQRSDLSGLAIQKARAPKVIQSGSSAKNRVYDRAAGAGPNMAYKSIDTDGDYAAFDMAEAIEEEAFAPHISDDEIASSFQSLATQAQLGSFDELKIDAPITIPDSSTALINLVQKKVPATQTYLFTANPVPDEMTASTSYSLNQSWQSLELTNTTGTALEAGPITIYKNGTVIGEGYLSRTENNNKAFITFAGEGRIKAHVTIRNTSRDFDLVSFQNNECIYTTRSNWKYDIRAESRFPENTVTTIQFPRENNQDTDSTTLPANAVETASSWLIPIRVKPNAQSELHFTITRHNQGSNRATDRNQPYCRKAIQNAIDSGSMTHNTAKQFRRYLELQDQIADLNSAEVQKNKQMTLLNTEQNRLNKSLASLKDIKTADGNALRSQYLSRQKEIDRQISTLTTEHLTIQNQLSENTSEFQKLIRTLEYGKSDPVKSDVYDESDTDDADDFEEESEAVDEKMYKGRPQDLSVELPF